MKGQHEKMVEGQKAKKRRTHDLIVETMRNVEQEIEQDGCYSENKGVLNQKELCRRANVAPGTLKNKHHEELRKTLKIWLEKQTNRAPSTKKDALKVARRSIAELEAKTRKMSAEVLKLRQYTEDLEERLRRCQSNVHNMK